MFSKIPDNLCKRTEFRLTAWYSAVFILWALFLFFILSVLIFTSIRSKERRIVHYKAEKYYDIASKESVGDLLSELKLEQDLTSAYGLFIVVMGRDGTIRHASLPQGWEGYNPRTIVEDGVRKAGEWIVFRGEGWLGGDEAADRGDTLEIIKRSLPDGAILYLGQSSEDIDDILFEFYETFFILIVPLFILAVSGGFFMSWRTLKPLKELIHAVERVESGEMDARVPSRNTGDELDELATLFNRMLGKIECLIRGMREALDNVAHDLKTPMARMRASIEKTVQAESDRDTLQEALMDCAEESERVVDMLNALMDISEAETGAMNLRMERVSLFDLVENICELYSYPSEDKNIRLSMAVPETLSVQADPNRLYQVIANLMDNAVKYTPENGRVHIAAVITDTAVTVTVEDSGPGIADEDITRIFERLYRGDKSRSQRGLGLGLALVQAVVHAHGGEITASNLPGGGACFTLEMPTGQSR